MTTLRAFAFFGTVTVVKTLVELLLKTLYVSQVNEEAYMIFPALDIFETLLTFYVLYCSFMFCSCLAQGIIYEWAPVEKFAMIAALAMIVVCQDFIIYTFLSMFPPEIASIDEDSGQLTMQEQSLLSLQISSFFISIEAAVLLVLISRHFEIKTGGDS